MGAKFANVQPHSGASQLCGLHGLDWPEVIPLWDGWQGGHLTHGAPVSFSGQTYNFVSYSVDPETELLDFDAILKQAQKVKPKLIVAVHQLILKLSTSQNSVKSQMLLVLAYGRYGPHIAGLVAAGLHPSPVPYAHITTTTTHKTLRGPRGGLILTNDED